jgi:UDP-3-O-[3-hydroxymyristoyl] glucosamine N-acyltransferase
MPTRRFYKNLGPFKLEKIAPIIGASVPDNQSGILIHNVKSLKEATDTDITFLSNKKYISEVANCKAAACLVPLDFVATLTSNIVLLKVPNPYYSYALIIDLFYTSAKKTREWRAPSAFIAKSAKIGKNCYIGHNVVIEENAEIGDDCIIESGSLIDYGVKVGNRARIDSSVSISYSILGDDVVILPGARIGQDGFGFATSQGVHKKIYHTGAVVIGNNVEIGANSTIDRGSMNDTIIEDLCRIDNLVQIGHNAHIKKGTILVAQVGIAGSSVIGSYCALGGQVGVAGHITIADNVQIAGQGGVIQDIKEPGIMGGTPAVPIRDWHKQTIMLRKLINEKKK